MATPSTRNMARVRRKPYVRFSKTVATSCLTIAGSGFCLHSTQAGFSVGSARTAVERQALWLGHSGAAGVRSDSYAAERSVPILAIAAISRKAKIAFRGPSANHGHA